MRRTCSGLLSAVLLGSVATPVIAQAPASATPPSATGQLVAFGSIRARGYWWNWFGGDPGGEYAYPAALIRVGLSRAKPSFDWQIEIALPILIGLPASAVRPPPQGQLGLGATYFAANGNSENAATLFPKQAFVRFRHVGGVAGQSVAVGRMEFNDGTEVAPRNATLAALKRDRISQRLLGAFGFSDVGRSIDGAQYTRAGEKTNVTVIGGRPTQGVFQVNGWRELNVVLAYGAVTGQVDHARAPAEWRIFGLGYDDYRHGVVKTDNRPAAARNADAESIAMATFGGHYLQVVPTGAGPADVLFWVAGQSGSWGALTHRAAAFAAEAGWQPAALPAGRLWVRGGYDYASGDEDATDRVHGTFFQVLPTPRIYARLPFYNMMNSADAFGEIVSKPMNVLTLRADVHSVHLSDVHDLWYSGGGAFQPQTFGFTGRPGGAAALATLYDVSGDYIVNAHVTLSGYAGYAAGGRVAQAIYSGGSGAMLGYAEVILRF